MNDPLGLFYRLGRTVKRCGVVALLTGLLTLGGNVFARTASCPCPNPCPCSPCTCGGSGGKSPPSGGGKTKTSDTSKTTSKHHEGTADKGHHGDKGHGRDHGHGGGGAAISVYIPDGIGQRKHEGDPFASSPEQPVAHTQEKPDKPKTKQKELVTANPFTNVELTGGQAKAETIKAGDQ